MLTDALENAKNTANNRRSYGRSVNAVDTHKKGDINLVTSQRTPKDSERFLCTGGCALLLCTSFVLVPLIQTWLTKLVWNKFVQMKIWVCCKMFGLKTAYWLSQLNPKIKNHSLEMHTDTFCFPCTYSQCILSKVHLKRLKNKLNQC